MRGGEEVQRDVRAEDVLREGCLEERGEAVLEDAEGCRNGRWLAWASLERGGGGGKRRGRTLAELDFPLVGRLLGIATQRRGAVLVLRLEWEVGAEPDGGDVTQVAGPYSARQGAAGEIWRRCRSVGGSGGGLGTRRLWWWLWLVLSLYPPARLSRGDCGRRLRSPQDLCRCGHVLVNYPTGTKPVGDGSSCGGCRSGGVAVLYFASVFCPCWVRAGVRFQMMSVTQQPYLPGGALNQTARRRGMEWLLVYGGR